MPYARFITSSCFDIQIPLVGANGQNRTGMELPPTDFKSVVSTYFTTLAIFGVPPGTRTPTNSFGDCDAAITLGIHYLGGNGEIRTHGRFLVASFQD